MNKVFTLLKEFIGVAFIVLAAIGFSINLLMEYKFDILVVSLLDLGLGIAVLMNAADSTQKDSLTEWEKE